MCHAFRGSFTRPEALAWRRQSLSRRFFFELDSFFARFTSYPSLPDRCKELCRTTSVGASIVDVGLAGSSPCQPDSMIRSTSSTATLATVY